MPDLDSQNTDTTTPPTNATTDSAGAHVGQGVAARDISVPIASNNKVRIGGGDREIRGKYNEANDRNICCNVM